MTSFNIEFEQLARPTKLYSDYLSGGLKEFYKRNFLGQDGLHAAAAEISGRQYDRRRLQDILRENNTRLGASSETLSNIDLLSNPETLCIFAGQQASICCSPMFVIYKALVATKLAERLGAELKKPVVPCFWLATDDHDFEEVRTARLLERTGELVTLSYDPETDPAGAPVAEIKFDDGIQKFRAELDQTLIDTEFKGPLLNKLIDWYKPGVSFAESFGRLFNHFIGQRGIILVDPNFRGLKELFKPIYLKEVVHHDKTFDLYKQRTEQIVAGGYHAQVHKTGENLNLFYHDTSRQNLTIAGDVIIGSDSSASFEIERLRAMIESSPEKFSSNVLLRPIAQCAAFPTVAQVVGPSELAYFAQIEPLFGYFDVPFPVVIPRSGMTIMEPHIGKIVHKYDIELSQLRNNLDSLIGDVVERLFPSQAAESVTSLNRCIKDDLDKFARKLEKSDPEGYRHIVNFKKHVDYELQQLQKKLKASNKKRHDELTDQIRKANAFLFPDGNLQERVLSPVYFANKFGPDLFNKIYEAIDVERPVHTVLEL